MDPLTFKSFHLHPDVMAGTTTLGYNTPTPLQSRAIPLIIQGKDVIGLGKSGPSKTAAFILPILHRLKSGEPGSTRALILTPTLELAEQTSEAINRLGSKTGLKNLVAYPGGTAKQVKEMRGGPDIITGCPNYLLSYLWKGTINLADLETLVIDEADSMSELGFLPDIFNVLMCISQKRQTLLFSATMPEKLRRLSKQFLNDPVTVTNDPGPAAKPVPQAKKPATPTPKPNQNTPHTSMNNKNQALSDQNQALRNQNQSLRSQNQNLRTNKTVSRNPNTTQSAEPTQGNTKTTFLKDIVNKSKGDSVLVFTRALKNAGRVALQLKKAGYDVIPLKGKLATNKKQASRGGLPGGPVIILVVKDNAARGIDVSKIFRTINYETPEGTVDNEHRVGRMGKVDEYGDAIALVTSANAINIYALEQILEAPLAPLDSLKL